MPLEMDSIVENKLNKALALTLRAYANAPGLEHPTVFKLKAWIKLATEDQQAFFDCLTEFDTPAEKEAFRIHIGHTPTRTPADQVQQARKSLRVIGSDDSDKEEDIPL
jgi:hypothetical protein